MVDVKPNLGVEMERDDVAPVVVVKDETSVIMLDQHSDIPPSGLFVGGNGRTWILKPGRWFRVPKLVRNILDDAVTSQPMINPDTLQVMGHMDKMRFSYRVKQDDVEVRGV